MAFAKQAAIDQRARRLMEMIDERLGGVPSTNRFADARVRVLVALLQEVELAIDEAKEFHFE